MGRYDSQWRNYRRLRLLSLLFFLPFIPVIFVLCFHGSFELPVLFPFLMFFGFVGAVASFVLNYFRCPRRNKFFAITWWYNLSIFARECVHCGLRKFSDGD